MIDRQIGNILTLKNIDHFSAVEIRTAYIAIQRDEQLDPASVRRFVYEELLKLVKKGWLKKQTSNKKGVTRYIKTNLFEYDYFKKLVSSISEPINEIDEQNYKQTLTTRLKQYNTDLLEGLGAVKEYIELKDIHPELHTHLKQRYMAVQENNHILKGKIGALNELIKSNAET
jgi:predicted DNA-binding transcriptional regulator